MLYCLSETVNQDWDHVVTTVGSLGHGVAGLAVAAHDLNT
jgi:hypothetical protein